MIVKAVVDFFKYKVVGSIVILSCWPAVDQVKLVHQISQYGLSSTFCCDPTILDYTHRHRLQGVLYFANSHDDEMFKKVKRTHFLTKYKWLIVGDRVPDAMRKIRYDADVALLELEYAYSLSRLENEEVSIQSPFSQVVHFSDVYIHPRDGIAVHRWAFWTAKEGFILTHEREKILRRQDLKKYPLKIATPVGHYVNDTYEGTFANWLDDESIFHQDPAIRSAYHTSMLLVEAVNGQDILIENELWVAVTKNNSMYVMLSTGEADLSGAVLRILLNRIYAFDFVVTIWPFRVGFTYLAERESNSNMYVEPFSPAVWWACLAMLGVLALVQRATSKNRKEQDGALFTVLTTYLQQDASAVPQGVSGRWSFTVLSFSALLVHAYYSSAIISALMSTVRGGPDSLRALADSKYSIASEDYDDMRYVFFDVKTPWDDLEYLKKKKITSKFYQKLEKGVELIQQGSTAFHSEYNQIYPHFKTFSDDQICKLQHVDTIPETLAWVTSTKDGQWTNTLRIAGAWLLETGLAKRLLARLQFRQPPCRAALLAERVKLGDVAPLLLLTIFGAVLSLIMLAVELAYAKAQRKRNKMLGEGITAIDETTTNVTDVVEYDIN